MEATERTAFRIAFDEVLSNFGSDGFENVPQVRQYWKVAQQGVARLSNVFVTDVPIRRRHRSQQRCRDVGDGVVGKTGPCRWKNGGHHRGGRQSNADATEHGAIPKFNEVGKVVPHRGPQPISTSLILILQRITPVSVDASPLINVENNVG